MYLVLNVVEKLPSLVALLKLRRLMGHPLREHFIWPQGLRLREAVVRYVYLLVHHLPLVVAICPSWLVLVELALAAACLCAQARAVRLMQVVVVLLYLEVVAEAAAAM